MSQSIASNRIFEQLFDRLENNMQQWKAINTIDVLSESSEAEAVPSNSLSSWYPERIRKSILSKSSVGISASNNDLSFNENSEELGPRY